MARTDAGSHNGPVLCAPSSTPEPPGDPVPSTSIGLSGAGDLGQPEHRHPETPGTPASSTRPRAAVGAWCRTDLGCTERLGYPVARSADGWRYLLFAGHAARAPPRRRHAAVGHRPYCVPGGAELPWILARAIVESVSEFLAPSPSHGRAGPGIHGGHHRRVDGLCLRPLHGGHLQAFALDRYLGRHHLGSDLGEVQESVRHDRGPFGRSDDHVLDPQVGPMTPSFSSYLVNDPFGDPGLYVEIKWARRALLFDLGQNDALGPTRLLRASEVFVSHTHMDHFIGFDRLLRIALGRRKALRIYGPPGLIENVAGKLRGYTWNLVDDYPFTIDVREFHSRQVRHACFRASERFLQMEGSPEIHTARIPFPVLIDPMFTVFAAPLNHRIASFAYALQEKFHVNINKERLRASGLPVGSWLK